MRTVLCLLLLYTASLAYAQITGITLTLNGVTFEPDDIITMETLGSGANGLIASTTHRPCCSGTPGNWFLPGTNNPLSGDSTLTFYQSKTTNGEVTLNRDNIQANGGLFRVNIPNASGTPVDVHIGIYPDNDGAPESVSIERTGSAFMCTSTGGPATTVVWRHNCQLLTSGTRTQQVLGTDNSQYESMLVLTSVPDGDYSCTVENRRGRASASITIGVSPFTVSIAPSVSPPTAGQPLTLTCSSSGSAESYAWIDSSDATISSESALVFSELRESQREFSCVVTQAGQQRCAQYYSSVQLPDYSVSLAGSIAADITTTTLILTCSVAPSNLPVTSYSYYKGDSLLETSSNSMYSKTTLVGVADTGNDYSCVGVLSLDFLDLSSPLTLTSSLTTVTVTIPSPRMTLTPPNNPYSGDNVLFGCGLIASGLTGITVDIALLKDNVEVTGTSRIMAQGLVVAVPNVVFTTNYDYRPLSRIEDMGTYHCEGTVRPEDPSFQQFVTNGVAVSDELTVEIADPVLEIEISSVTGRILDIAPYNSFTLTCTARSTVNTASRDITKSFQWSESGTTVTTGVGSTDLSMATSTSTLTVSATQARTYEYQCTSVLELGAIPDSVQESVTSTVVVYGPTNPNIPSGLVITRVDHQSASLQWTVASLSYDRESYTVSYSNISTDLEYSSEEVQGNTDISLENQMYTVELTGLLPLSTYYYSLIVTNGHGSVQTALASFNTTGVGPGSPEQLTYVASGGLEFEFSWLPPNVTEDVMIGQYRLTCMASLRSENVFPLVPLDLPTNLTSVSTTLTAWAQYTCFVVASNQDGVSPPSNEITLTTPETAPTGMPQQFFEGINPMLGVVPFTWSPPELTQRNGAITGYSLACIATDHTVEVMLDPSPSNSYEATGFRAVTEYVCSVRAVNSAGMGPAATITVMSGEDAPGAPPGMFSVQPNTTSAQFSWSPPPSDQLNGVLTGYTVSCTTTVGVPVSSDYSPSSTSGLLSGLTPARQYSCSIVATTAPGSGPEAQLTLTTVPLAPSGVTVQAPSSTQLSVNWSTSPADTITEYIVYIDGVEAGRSSGSEFTVPSLAPYTLYNVQVSAVNEGGESTRTVTQNIRTLEDYPGIVSCNERWESSNQTSVTVTWSPPVMENGVTLAYHLTLSAHASPDQVLARVNVTSSERQATVSLPQALVDGVPYSIAIVAENSVGQSQAACMAIDFTRQLTPPPPRNVQLSRSEVGDITVVWSIPTLTEARGYLSYSIAFQPDTPSARKRRQSSPVCTSSPCVVPVDQGSITISNLDAGTGYDVTVTPVNEMGEQGQPLTMLSEALPAGLDIAVIAGAAGGGIIVVLLVLVFLILCCICCSRRRRGKKGKYFATELELEQDPNPQTIYTATNPVGSGAGPYTASPRRETLSPLRMTAEDFMKPIDLEFFPEFVKDMHKDRNKGFDRAFQVLPGDNHGTCTAAKKNKDKNKYQMLPYDSSRVKLSGDSDYINASYIHGYSRKNMYIAAQGPMPSTKDDFWRMIWELKLAHVVVLTKCRESGKIKCERYWPQGANQDYISSNLQITCSEVTPYADYEIRKLYVSDMNDPDKPGLVVNHYQFTGWPENVIPEYATSLIAFIRRVRGRYNPEPQSGEPAPLLVHCSEGVGRTGAFIVLDTILERMKEQNSVNIFETLHNIRLNRSHMVKTLDQFVFIHDAVNEMVLCGTTAIAAADIRDKVKSLHKIRQDREVASEFKLQFELLAEVSPKEQCSQEALQYYNVGKNRYSGEVDKMPNANSMVYLKHTGSQGSEYINASYVNGYKHKHAYIATQAPLSATVEDFWRMVWEQQSRTIVMLCDLIEEKKEASHCYWPDKVDTPVACGRFWVTLLSEEQIEQSLIRRVLTLSGDQNADPSEGMSVTQFHFTGWPETDRPIGTEQVLRMLEDLDKVQRSTSNKPITVMCNDGIGRTGAFICIHCQWEKVKTEGTVDLFQFIKSARLHRNNLITELEHYIFCHDIIADYVDTFKESDYKNFS